MYSKIHSNFLSINENYVKQAMCQGLAKSIKSQFHWSSIALALHGIYLVP